jgi:hypothetical protein
MKMPFPVETAGTMKPYQILQRVLGISVSKPTMDILVMLGQHAREEVHAVFSPITGIRQSASWEFDESLKAIRFFLEAVLNEAKQIIARHPELYSPNDRMKRLGIEMRRHYPNGSCLPGP